MKNPKQAVNDRFNVERRIRPWAVSHFGGMEAAKLHPLAICKLGPDEAGTFQTNLNLQLAPVNGHMRSKAYAEVVQVFVPYQALEVLELDTQPDAGVTEMTRRRLLAGTVIGLEDQGTISKAAFVHPRSVGGAKRVSKSVRLAYLAAVNHLRRMAYYDAAQVTKTETAILPALLTANILARFDGVLDPERQIDGAINLTGELPITATGALADIFVGTASTNDPRTKADGTSLGTGNSRLIGITDTTGAWDNTIAITGSASLGTAGAVTLRDMMQSKLLDAIIRDFAGMIKRDPLHGEEAVARAIFGLSVDYDDDCQVMYRMVHELTPAHHRPSDGPSINDIQAHFELSSSFSTLVPKSELGGQLVTLVSVKPMETLEAQPDPHQTEAWTLVNRVHDELELDEQQVTRADLESDVAAIDEDTPAFWVGHNRLKHGYMSSGPNVQQTNLVEQKSSMWLYAVPTSVTPDNVSYPASIDMYPFANWSGSHAEYTIEQRAMISTTLNKGPNPVEKIELFATSPELIGN